MCSIEALLLWIVLALFVATFFKVLGSFCCRTFSFSFSQTTNTPTMAEKNTGSVKEETHGARHPVEAASDDGASWSGNAAPIVFCSSIRDEIH